MNALIRIAIVFIFASLSSFSQVEVFSEASSNTYPRLKLAFDAINAGTHKGDITILLTGNTVEIEAAVLYASGTGSSFYSSIVIMPSGGGSRFVQGSFSSYKGVIHLDGADNVRIDGLRDNSNSLTIASMSNGTSVYFTGGATNNILTRCDIKGSITISGAGSATAGNGNEDNTISDCDIGPYGPALQYAVWGYGSLGRNNDNIKIINNRIHDYFVGDMISSGVYINENNSFWTIEGNYFFHTSAKTYTAGVSHSAIWIADGTFSYGHIIRGNIIGKSELIIQSTYELRGVAGSSFYGIYCNGAETYPSKIMNNTVNAISLSGSFTGMVLGLRFHAIYAQRGVDSICWNTIGSVASSTISVSNISTGPSSYIWHLCI
ncbi:MAG: hypothetical protein QHI48_04425 [Bacteroidota bacterium]|nr:hypothetical protein [Bacteroidota bacterium]